MSQKKFFKEPTKSQISRRKENYSENPLDIESIKEGQYVVTSSPLLNTNFILDDPVDFQKHGPEIRLRRYLSIEAAEADVEKGVIPLHLRQEAYERARKGRLAHACYSFVPLIGNDKRRRRVGLVQILDGARIFAFSESLRKKLGVSEREFYEKVKYPGIKVKPYDNAKGTAKDGAQLIVRIPSSENNERYQFRMSGIAVDNNSRKLAISHGLGSNHQCGFSTFKELRYPFAEEPETSNVFQVCKHETAAVYAIIDYCLKTSGLITPLETTQIALPSKRFQELYKRMLDSWLIYDETLETRDKLRKPLQAEKEIVLDAAVKLFEYDEALFCNTKRDGKLKDYDWTLRK